MEIYEESAGDVEGDGGLSARAVYDYQAGLSHWVLHWENKTAVVCLVVVQPF